MKVDVVMPKMGESLQEGTIIKWLKQVGDRIERDEMILEISTDKVDTEVPSPVSGILTTILASEGDTVEVNKKIAEIETEATEPVIEPAKESIPQSSVETKIETVQETIVPSEESVGNIVDVVMPKMGESLQEGTIIKWLKKPGDSIERDEMILEISTDKVDTEVPSPVSGILTEILANESETVEVGKVIARISTGGQAIPTSIMKEDKKEDITSTVAQSPEIIEESESDVQTLNDSSRISGNRFYSPLVRSIAEKEGVSQAELDSIKGTGMEGRVNKKDILDYIEKRKSAPQRKESIIEIPKAVEVPQAPKVEIKQEPIPAPTFSGPDVEIIPMDRVRQLIAEHMVYSKQTSAHVTSVGEADVTGIFKFREKSKADFEKREGFKLTYTPFFAKAAIDGIRAFPRVNVSVDGKNIILHKRINLSVATALDDGNLIVPVIKNADALSISGLARYVFDLASRARSKKLNPEDIQGGTFTITNVGTFGTLFGTPVINQPQTAIMGIGAIKKRPVVIEVEGEDLVVVRHMAYVSITYDHRVIDGMLAGQCLAAIIKSLESMNEKTITF